MYKKYVGVMVAFALISTSLPIGSVRADEDATTTDAVASTTETVAAAAAPEEMVVEQTQAVLPIVTGTCYEPVLPQLVGDVNMDGNVNLIDKDLLTASYNASSTEAAYNADADFNHDGIVDFLDLAAFGQKFNITKTVEYTAFANLGDFNHDGAINSDDNTILAATYNLGSTTQGFNAKADLNQDGIVDFLDMAIMAQNFNKVSLTKCVPVVPPSTPNNNGGGSSNNGGGGIGTTTATLTSAVGQVLGASTSIYDGNACPAYIAHYIKFGANNNLNDVVNLQIFLRKNIDANVKITGAYDAASLAAVNAFQVKYSEDVLAPWVQFGLPTATTSTGYVYKTSKWKINSLMCPTFTIAKPMLP